MGGEESVAVLAIYHKWQDTMVRKQESYWNQGSHLLPLPACHPSALVILFSRNMEFTVLCLTLQMGRRCFSMHVEKGTIP